jgi:hypothetical protein
VNSLSDAKRGKELIKDPLVVDFAGNLTESIERHA